MARVNLRSVHAPLLISVAVFLSMLISCGGAQPETPSVWVYGQWELDLSPLIAGAQADAAAEEGADNGEPAAEPVEAEEAEEAEDDAAEDDAAPAAQEAPTYVDRAAEERLEQERQFADAIRQGFRMRLSFEEEGVFKMNGTFMDERSELRGSWEVLSESMEGLLLQLRIDGEISEFPLYFRGNDQFVIQDDGQQLIFNRRGEAGS